MENERKNVRNVGLCCAPVEGGCQHKAVTKGLCRAHYERMRHGRDMTAPVGNRGRKKAPERACQECGRVARLIAFNLCWKCYQRKRRLKKKENEKASTADSNIMEEAESIAG